MFLFKASSIFLPTSVKFTSQMRNSLQDKYLVIINEENPNGVQICSFEQQVVHFELQSKAVCVRYLGQQIVTNFTTGCPY